MFKAAHCQGVARERQLLVVPGKAGIRGEGSAHDRILSRGVWREILDWLQQQQESKAAELLGRLMARYPGRYSRRQLRTLQRRVRQ